jgi:hypothetical protein
VQEINFKTIQKQYANTIWRKGDLVRDFENFNFLHLKIPRTREKRFPAQSGVVGVSLAKVISETVGVCVAVIGNNNVKKAWTVVGTTNDCPVLLFGLQRKSLCRDVVSIPRVKGKFLRLGSTF